MAALHLVPSIGVCDMIQGALATGALDPQSSV